MNYPNSPDFDPQFEYLTTVPGCIAGVPTGLYYITFSEEWGPTYTDWLSANSLSGYITSNGVLNVTSVNTNFDFVSLGQVLTSSIFPIPSGTKVIKRLTGLGEVGSYELNTTGYTAGDAAFPTSFNLSFDYDSFFTTGFRLDGQALRKWQPLYVYVFSRHVPDEFNVLDGKSV